MAKTYYSLGVNYLIEVDPSKPASVTKAAEWMQKMADGQIVVPADGLNVVTEITKAPAITNKRDAKPATPALEPQGQSGNAAEPNKTSEQTRGAASQTTGHKHGR